MEFRRRTVDDLNEYFASRLRALAAIIALIFPPDFWAPNSYASCFVGVPDDCPDGKVCAKYNKAGDSKCVDTPKAAPIVFDLPFDEYSKVYCTQSGRLSTATHVYQNMLYAIDLASDYKSSSAAVYASAPGKAYVHTGCKNPAGKPEQTKVDACGLGYGNHVFLLHDGGYISIYAHLSDVFVKNGEMVKARQSIGIEGATGQAAHRHLHWDVHKLEGSITDWERVLSQPGWGGYSVPYRFRVKINGTEKIVNSSEIACRWLDQTQAPWTGSYRGLNDRAKVGL
jgi:Peptidase family M23